MGRREEHVFSEVKLPTSTLGAVLDWHDHRRTGRGGQGGAVAPPIRAVCRHEFGQRVDIILAKHNTCLKNTY